MHWSGWIFVGMLIYAIYRWFDERAIQKALDNIERARLNKKYGGGF